MKKASILFSVLWLATLAYGADMPARPDLRDELLRMRAEDQRARGEGGTAVSRTNCNTGLMNSDRWIV